MKAKNVQRHIDNMRSEVRREEDLQWLSEEGDELIRLHRKLKGRKSMTLAERGFLADIVYFALGESIRVDDEAANQEN